MSTQITHFYTRKACVQSHVGMKAIKTLTCNLKANLDMISFEQIYSGAQDSSIGSYCFYVTCLMLSICMLIIKKFKIPPSRFENFCAIKELINITTTVCSYRLLCGFDSIEGVIGESSTCASHLNY